ncbi:hypothetical protein [Leptothrix discophora]|uniref:DUF4123 domain-containing protein n=1 Tax=Leptothrix discophora TaxID=89 RepID=A0ABT9G3M8_LEPDI|nr:hypothetical protein [Leptothrix discophora]MDP4301096.1 hypothetical protein [Leptothrix discophora]
MSRLQTEFRRLYLSADAASPDRLIDAQGRVRALVLALTRPADWEALAPVWRGVQVELGLPAPAIAASGTDALQLWFSVVEPMDVDAAQAFLALLRRRWLADLPAQRLALWPSPAGGGEPARHARPVPALNEATGNWSAFVAPDLAPLFAETPWLDIPPGDEAQAGVLGALASIQPAALASATAQLKQASHQMTPPAPASVDAPTAPILMAASTHTEPRAFLLAVMNDAAVPLALRIEAAKALLGAA